MTRDRAFPDENTPHRRFNPLTGEWVLVSPQRTQRPWKGQTEKVPQVKQLAYDPECYLCPGNTRSGGKRNPDYSATFVFDNDFPALLPIRSEERPPRRGGHQQGAQGGIQDIQYLPQGLFQLEEETGICRVVCFSPLHNASLPDLSSDQVKAVIETWIAQSLELQKQEFIRYVQVFENKGSMMGASNPHPHCQIWATGSIPNEPAKELSTQKAYQDQNQACLLCDYLHAELKIKARIILENEYFCALVPYWAIWPFETLVLSKRHIALLPDMSPPEIEAMGNLLQRLTSCYDRLFEVSFPYSMGFHQAPVNDGPHPEWHLHAHFYPPLLRSATVRKFMVGFELLASPQRDLTAETAAERLRSLLSG
jgi:UDPglucose--hexose-1-phosphate uridylyltransferase